LFGLGRNQRCYDRNTRRFWNLNETYTKIEKGRTLDCICKQKSRNMIIECSTSNRCVQNGQSYLQGASWILDESGVDYNCTCKKRGVITCRGSVMTEVSEEIRSGNVYRNGLVRSGIAALQACDIGHKVVTAGFSWNETIRSSDEVFVIKRCVCINALITCRNIIKSRSREPHCLTEQGEVHLVGTEWIKYHQFERNLKWKCVCRSNANPECHDIGTCSDPVPPSNGAMLCIVAQTSVVGQTNKYCQTLCNTGYSTLSPKRHTPYEVCGRINRHRWDVGFFSNPLLIAKCVSSARRSRYRLDGRCRSLSEESIEEVKSSFMTLLQRRGLCRYGCSISSFRCG